MDMNEERRQRIARQIVARRAMARGAVVLDENHYELRSALQEAGFRVTPVSSGLSDEQIIRVLNGKILITANPKDFEKDASKTGFGVIGLDKLEFIDPDPSFAVNKTVQLISKAWSAYKLKAQKKDFVLSLRSNGRHVLRTST